jgi:ribosomal protein S8
VYNNGCNENKKYFIVFLKYIDNKSVISNIEVFLKRRNPFFISSESLWKVKSINNLYLLSTPKFGIVSDRVANFYNTGGEVLLKIA